MEPIPLSRNLRIFGGVLGIVAVLVMIPAYVVGSPEAPTDPAAAEAYFAEASGFVLANGIIPIAHVVAFLLFLSVLVTVVGNAFTARAAVLGGGLVGIALTAAGFAAEILFPAATLRGADPGFDPLVALTLAVWFYHFAQAALAVMMIGVAMSAFAGVFPRWFAWVSLVFALLSLLHTWVGIWSAIASLVWILIASLVVMLKRDVPATLPATS